MLVPPFVMAVVGFCGTFLVLRLSYPYFAPFFFGLFLAFIMDVPVSYLQGKGWSRSVTSMILAAVAFLTLPLLVTFLLIKLWEEIQGLSSVSNLFVGSATMYYEKITQFLEILPILGAELSIDTLVKWALAIPDLLVIWTFTILSAYFLCRDKKVVTRYLARQFPGHAGFNPRQIYVDTSGALWRFLQVQLILMLISTIVSTTFFLALDLPYALLSGFLVGVCDLIPILGPGLVYLVLALAQIWSGNTLTALALGIGYLILLLLRQWGEPRLVSERLGLHPLVALVGLYAGFRFWGPLGAIISPILMVFLKALLPNDR